MSAGRGSRGRRSARVRVGTFVTAAALFALGASAVPATASAASPSPGGAIDAVATTGGAEPAIYVDGASDLGSSRWLASGFLHDDAARLSLAQSLRPQTWRMSAGSAWYDGAYLRARRHGAKVMWILSDDWSNLTHNYPMWDDWPAYDSFVRWEVHRAMAEAPVAYWDVQNEPPGFAPSGGTLRDYLDIYLHAYRAIKSVDPSARIVGPSIAQFAPAPPSAVCDLAQACGIERSLETTGVQIDLQTFIRFAAAHRLHFYAITWHEICMGGPDCANNPHDLVAHVAEARSMLRAYEAEIGRPKIMINEYLPPQVQDVPGWVVGFIASLEAAGVRGVHSCWPEPPPSGVSDCASSNLDGLAMPGGLVPRSAWWVYEAYAKMQGTRLATTVPAGGSDATGPVSQFSAFATSSARRRQIRVLIGRHAVACSKAPGLYCTPAQPPAPQDVTLAVEVPWKVGSVRAELRRLPEPTVNDQPDTTGFVDLASESVRVSGGVARLVLPQVADGDAWYVVLDARRPAPSPGVPPAAPGYCPVSTCTPSGPAGTFQPTGSMYGPLMDDAAALLDNGKVLVAGGYFNGWQEPFAKLYDPATGDWSPTGSMAVPRVGLSLTTLANGDVLAAGGYSGSPANPLASAELYDPASGTWSPAGSMGTARWGQSATLLPNGEVLVAGGYGVSSSGAQYVPSASVELYDPSSGTWGPAESLAEPLAGQSATLLPDGEVLVAGGASAGGLATTAAELFDPATGSWTPTGSMAVPRAFQSATLLPDGKVLVAGGAAVVGANSLSTLSAEDPSVESPYGTLDSGLTATAEVYDPATGRFAATAPMPLPVARQRAVGLPDGNVLLLGGEGEAGRYVATSAIYSPSSRTWASGPAMATARAFFSATVLGNGQVLVAGGLDCNLAVAGRCSAPYHSFLVNEDFQSILSSAELYIPFRPTG